MDSTNDVARAKWLLIAVVIFLGSGCLSWGELIYLFSGKDGQATVVKSYEVTKRGRIGLGQRKRQTIDYSFAEADGTSRTGTATVSPDWPVPADGKVAIRYTAGADGDSRLAGHVNWIGISIFGLSLGAVGLFGYRLYREASEATRDRKPR